MSGTYVVAYSSGAGSYEAARRVISEIGPDAVTLVFTDTLIEDEDNYRFLRESAAHLGAALVVLADGRTPFDVFKDKRFLGNTRLANCSHELKQKPFRAWLDANCDPASTTVVVGIDWSESHRLAAPVRSYAPFVVRAPLCEAPYVDKARILADLEAVGIKPPRLYGMGFAHANCGGGCVRAGQGQFAHLLSVMPGRYAEWEANEQGLRDYLDKDVAILRDRTGGSTVPLTLTRFRERHEAQPEQTDLFDIGGCGCFVDAS